MSQAALICSSRTSAITPQATAPTIATAVQIATERPRDLVLTAYSPLCGSRRRVSSPPPGSRKRPHACGHGGREEDHDKHRSAREDGEDRSREPGRAGVEREPAARGAERLVDDERGEDRGHSERGYVQRTLA